MHLENIKDEIFYHIQRGPVPPGGHTWEIGKRDFWGKEPNFFIKKLFTDPGYYMTDTNNGFTRNSLEVFQEMHRFIINALMSPERKEILQNNISQIAHMYQEMDVCLHYQIYLIRELMFEEIRKEINSELPSRYTGLFVALLEDLDHWMKVLQPNEPCTIIKLKLNGKAFLGNNDYVPLMALTVDEWKTYALKYWNSCPGFMPENRYEYLFEGESEVLEVLQPKDFGLQDPVGFFNMATR